MERDDRAPVATFFVPLLEVGAVTLPEAAAHHARVKRLAVDDRVRLTDGSGLVAMGRMALIGKHDVDVEVETTVSLAPLIPLHLFVPVADRDRMLTLAEKAAEFGATSWHPVYFGRSRSVTPRGEGEAFEAKVRLRMIAALEQSGGAWLPIQMPAAELSDVISFDASSRIVLDVGGPPILSVHVGPPVAAMIGPEGGLEAAERDALRAAGWDFARVEANVLRFETAGIAALAVLRAMLVR